MWLYLAGVATGLSMWGLWVACEWAGEVHRKIMNDILRPPKHPPRYPRDTLRRSSHREHKKRA